MSAPRPAISVVIPANNEDARLGPMVTAIRDHLVARGGYADWADPQNGMFSPVNWLGWLDRR